MVQKMRLPTSNPLSVFILVTPIGASMSTVYAPDRCRCSDSEAGWNEALRAPPAEVCACCSDVCIPVHTCRKAECSHRAQTGNYSVIAESRRIQQKEAGIRQAFEASHTSGAVAFSVRTLPVLRIGIPSVPRHITTTILLI